jgi:hypothetical protein
MTQQGYSLVRQVGATLGGEPRFTMEHARKGEQVVTTLSRVDDQTTAMLQMRVGSDRPDALPNDAAVRESREAYEREQKAAQGGSK